MKKHFLSLLLVCFFGSVLQAQNYAPKEVTAKEYENAVKFLSFNTYPLMDRANVRPQWLEDGRFWYRISTSEGSEYVLVNSKNGKRSTAASKNELFEQASVSEAATPEVSRDEVLSPDNKKVAFIRDWNLWVRNLETGEETELTTDGVENYGYATDNAGWRKSDRPIILWSPDSKKIATFQQDQRHVSDMYLVETKTGAPNLQQWKYPIPGDEKVIQIERVIINVDDQKVTRLDVPADPRRGTLCDDISCSGNFDDNYWNEDATKLVFVSTSRDHKVEKLRIADAQTGEVREVLEESVPTQYESGQHQLEVFARKR